MKIYNKDCLEVLPTLVKGSIDLILIDAPYIISKPTNFHNGNNQEFSRKGKKQISMDFGSWDKEELNWQTLMTEFKRILKPNGTLIIFYDVFKLSDIDTVAQELKFKQPRVGVWQKNNPIPVNSKINYLTGAREYFVSYCHTSKPTFNSEYDKGYYEFPVCAGKERLAHPTQKPLALMESLVAKHSNEGDVVLDCFMGVGSTGEACKNLKRDFIGVELDEKYFNIAKERLED